VCDDDDNIKLMDELEEQVIKFRDIITIANDPINCGCRRSNCFGLKVRNLFHSNDQLECMLEKNFDGR